MVVNASVEKRRSLALFALFVPRVKEIPQGRRNSFFKQTHTHTHTHTQGWQSPRQEKALPSVERGSRLSLINFFHFYLRKLPTSDIAKYSQQKNRTGHMSIFPLTLEMCFATEQVTLQKGSIIGIIVIIPYRDVEVIHRQWQSNWSNLH